MVKILVIGFQRSGTTLLRKIFQKHPEVQIMFHEKRILNKPSQLKQQKNELKDKVWGEKVPFYGNSIDSYVNKWMNQFPDYRVIHIVRYPGDVLESNKKTFGFSYKKTTKFYNKYVPEVVNNFLNIKHIKFEDLVLEQQKVMYGLFQYCNLDSSKETINKIRSQKFKYFKNINDQRAFCSKLDMKYADFEQTINLIDKICSGPKYA